MSLHILFYTLNSSVENTKINSSITISGNKYEFDNKIVMYASDAYFYVTNLNDIQVYEQYDFSGNLVSQIVPSKSLESETMVNTVFWESDFSIIQRVHKDKYVYGYGLVDNDIKMFVCDFVTAECRYLDE